MPCKFSLFLLHFNFSISTLSFPSFLKIRAPHPCVCMLGRISRVQLCYPTTRLLCPWGFSRQESWSGWPCPPPGDLSNSGIKPVSPALLVESLPSEWPGWVVSNGGPEPDLRAVDTTNSERRRDGPFCSEVTVVFSMTNYIRYFIPTKWNLWVQLLSYINSMHIYWAPSIHQVQLGLWQWTRQACCLAWSICSGGLTGPSN